MSPARVAHGHNPLRTAQDRRLPRIAGPCGLVLFGVNHSVFLRIKRAVFRVDLLRSRGKHVSVFLRAKTDRVVAAVGAVGHAFSEGFGTGQLKE